MKKSLASLLFLFFISLNVFAQKTSEALPQTKNPLRLCAFAGNRFLSNSQTFADNNGSFPQRRKDAKENIASKT